MSELKNEEQQLQILINKFDSKLKLNELTDISYSRLVNWIAPVQREIDLFKKKWKAKMPFIVEKDLTLSYDASYQNDSSIIHCFDEEKYHLNNTSGYARFTTPFDNQRGIFFYSHPFNDYIACKIAENIGWQTLETSLVCMESSSFHNILGKSEDKICSLKKKIPNAVDPFLYIVSFFKQHQTKPLKDVLYLLEEKIDPQGFEDAFLFTWLVGETDGSSSKYTLVSEKEKMAFVKNNSLTSFSSNYFETDSFLLAFPNLHRPLSQKNREALLAFDETSIVDLMHSFEMHQSSIACFQDRVRKMKEIAKNKSPLLTSFTFIGLRKKRWKVESFLLKLYHEGIAFT